MGAALIPATGPDATPPVKALFSLKGRNPIVVAPHPRTADSTAAVVGFGAKDLALRNHFEKHFRPLEEAAGKPLPAARRRYFTIIHLDALPSLQGRTLSGTLARELLGDPAASTEARQQAFRGYFGWYDEEIFEWVAAKLRDARPQP